MIDDLLNLTSVQVAREVETVDGLGGATTTTTLTTLTKAAIWQNGGNNRFLSDRISRASTHVLAARPADYTWAQGDRYVTYNSETFKVIGRPDNVMNLSELTVVGLELIT